MNKFGLPSWLPYPTSWLNALILSVFMTGLVAAIRRSGSLEDYFANWSEQPEMFVVVLLVLLILPIPAIALFHHFFLGRLIPAIPGERMNNKGLVPGLMSWWESIYSWCVFVLSTLIATLISTPFLPLFKLNYEKILDTDPQPHRNVQAIFAVFWIISAAILYQVEYLFKNHLMFTDAMSYEKTVSQDMSVDVKPESKQDEVSATEIPSTEHLPQKKTNITDLIVKYRKLAGKIFTLILISLVALWIYLFANLPEVQQSVSTNLSSIEKQLAVTSKPASTKNDTFQKGVYKAKYAANLSKLAQSQEEWKRVARRWEEAIKLLEDVPTSSPNYGLAQQKILQYQLHREFAKQMLTGG